MGNFWRKRRAIVDSPAGRVINGSPTIPAGSAGPGDLLGSAFEIMGEDLLSYTSDIPIHPSADFAVIIVHAERCVQTAEVLTVDIGSSSLVVDSSVAPSANRDVVAIAYGTIDPSDNEMTVTVSAGNQAVAYTSYFFSGVTTVSEHTLQVGAGTTTPGMIVTFPWSPSAGHQLYTNFHTGRVGQNAPYPEIQVPDGNFIYNQPYLKAFGGARNAGPIYSLFKAVSSSSETNQFTLTYDADGAYDHTFCQFRVG